MIEYAGTDPMHGPYVRGGLGLFTHYYAVGPGGDLTLANDLQEYKLGAGWRIHPTRKGFGDHFSIDVFVNVDFGQFHHLSTGAIVGPHLEGDIRDDKLAWHATFDVGAGVRFDP
jgi:hypothetical protein